MFLTAKWLLPIDQPPIDGGWVEVEGERIVRLGRGRAPSEARDLGEAALMPGLVNAHTHLELSWLEGRVPPAPSMDEWITALIRVRRAGMPGGATMERRAAVDAAVRMRATGTVLVGDISNSLMTPAVLADIGLGGVIFHELLGFNTANAAGAVRDGWARVAKETDALAAREPRIRLDFSVVAHAPYSVSPALFRAIAGNAGRAPLSIHLAESAEEVEFLRTGRGPMRHMLEALGAWHDAWTVPESDPIQYVGDLGYLRPGTLAVHAVHVTESGLTQLRRAGAVVVTCPRSNEWVGAGMPPVSRFYASGIDVAVGTDSLASSPSLSLFDELSALRRVAPDVAASAFLESATRTGAEALGFGREFGTITPGKRAAFVAVDVPPGVGDVEEYLVSGIPPQAIHPVM